MVRTCWVILVPQTMRYIEHLPQPTLRQHVECIWFVTVEEPLSNHASERVLPDGCLEWIFHLGASFERHLPDGSWEQQPRSFLVGQLTRHLLLQPVGWPSVMGVRFRPGGAYRLLPFPLIELTDQTIHTADVWRQEGSAIEDAVFNAKTDSERVRLVEAFLLRQLSYVDPRPRFEATVAQIIESGGQTRVDQLAERVGFSARQLEREFRVSIGLSPKSFARIIRFQNLLRIVGEGMLQEWADVALAVGYSDQPHMVREFRAFTGQTPTEGKVKVVGTLAEHFISPQRLATLLGGSS